MDSSVSLEVQARGREAPELRRRVDQLLEQDRVATTGMVRLEVHGGAGSEREYDRLVRPLLALHQLPPVGKSFNFNGAGFSPNMSNRG